MNKKRKKMFILASGGHKSHWSGRKTDASEQNRHGFCYKVIKARQPCRSINFFVYFCTTFKFIKSNYF